MKQETYKEKKDRKSMNRKTKANTRKEKEIRYKTIKTQIRRKKGKQQGKTKKRSRKVRKYKKFFKTLKLRKK